MKVTDLFETTQTPFPNSTASNTALQSTINDQLKRLSKLPFKTQAKMEDLKKNWAVEYSLVD